MAMYRPLGAMHICGLYYLGPEETRGIFPVPNSRRNYLPLASLSAHTTILSSVSRTELTQTFTNPSSTDLIPELRYTFPLYDGVSVVGFTCTINNERVIRGLVQEKQAARQTFNDAVAKGQTAGLLEQLPDANDVFTTTIGNVPAGAEIKVEIIVLGELKHDAEVDGVRFTLPTHIAPRYGAVQGVTQLAGPQTSGSGISITVDVEMQAGSAITSLQSPSHPIGVTIGSVTSAQTPPPAPQFNLASATLSLGSTSLDKDFVLQVKATNASNPVAILETHPTLLNQRALMTTLVPKFNLPAERPEIVFVCDQSGSMEGPNMHNLRSALQLFLKSLPLGVRFNICSFGSHHSFLFPEGSRKYDADSLAIAVQAVSNLHANYGGTEMLDPIQSTFDKRVQGLDLEVIVLTDGQIHDQNQLFDMVNTYQGQSQGSIRIFTLGIGDGASTALIEGLARAGNGFAQTVGNHEKLDKKVVRMLKAALTAHITDYTLEIKYRKSAGGDDAGDDDGFELIDRVADLRVDVESTETEKKEVDAKPISLFDESVDLEATTDSPSTLPAVTVPRILQAPFSIPALFPFNRTNVYLLLSPETFPNVPETVILRGTSKHGPLALEIPVTATATSSTTIHQLAARKATLELEEGRGWIFHAKQQHEGGQEKLLKEAHPGRFDDMVEREAVRLGVQFQVGGKWCSFVAVEDNDDKNEVEKRDMRGPDSAGHQPASNRGQFSGSRGRGRGFGSPMTRFARDHFGNAQPAAQAFGQSAFQSYPSAATGGLFGNGPAQMMQSSYGGQNSFAYNNVDNHVAQYSMPSAGGLFGSSNATGPPPALETFFRMSAGAQGPQLFGSTTGSNTNQSSSSGLFGSSSANTAPPAGVDLMEMDSASKAPLYDPQSKGEDEDRNIATSACGTSQSSLFSSDREDQPAPRLKKKKAANHRVAKNDLFSSLINPPPAFSASGAFASYSSNPFHADNAPATSETQLETIVRLQSFEGFWTWSDTLAKVLGMDGRKEVPSEDDWVTIVVVAFLRKKLADDQDAWELVVDKALAWLVTKVESLEVVEEKIAQAWSEIPQ